MTRSNSKLNPDPALAELVKLLAQLAIQDYLQEIEQMQGEKEDGHYKNQDKHHT